MRVPLSSQQRRRFEELVCEKGERCTLCANADLRCDEDAVPYLGGGYNVRLLCTNTWAKAHAAGRGLARDYTLTPDEAQFAGLS